MESTGHSDTFNEVRSSPGATFSLPDVLTDVGIGNEGQLSDDIPRELPVEGCSVQPSTTLLSACAESTKNLSNLDDNEHTSQAIGYHFNIETVQEVLHTDNAPVDHPEQEISEPSVLNKEQILRLEDSSSIDSFNKAEPSTVTSKESVEPEFESKDLCVENRDYIMPQYTFDCVPQLITGVWKEFQKSTDECFTKGCKWSPDGTCILTNSDDNLLRIFDLPRELHCQEFWPEGQTLPELKPALCIKEGGRVYDYCWYPFMSSWNPLSCCLVSTSQFSPVHLWDAYTGQLRASYRSYNSVDEIDHAHSVAFNLTGEKLYCGFKKRLSVFDTASPGSKCENRSLKGLGRPVGIVSCICVNPANESIYAFSSYSRTIGLCTEPDGQVMCLLCNEGGGLTHIMFSPDGTRLYAGSRNDSQLFCWDMRNLGQVLFTSERTNKTNQRIYFDLTPDGHFLVSGSTNGIVHVWDTEGTPEQTSEDPFLPVKSTFQAHNDCVNGLSLHKQYPIMATSSGQRHPYCPDCESDEEGPPQMKKRHVHREDTVKLWWMGRNASPSTNR